jgi:hypothetical protein
MKADFSRQTFEATRHYSAVLMQQGRVQLDADWNEQLAIQRHRDYTEAEDVIGECGAPKHNAGFLVQPAPDGADLIIFPGRFYVHGRMCELEATPVAATFVSATQVTVAEWHVDGAAFAEHQYVQLTASDVASAVVRIQTADEANLQLTFTSSIAAFQTATDLQARRLMTYLTQPDLPDPPYSTGTQPPALDLPDGKYLLYIDVWPRHLTALDDDLTREKALDGPDTATRVKTLWQVKLWPGPGEAPPLPEETDCDTEVAGWDEMTAPPTGRLSARAEPGQEPGPCVLPPGAGYLGLENQLYRVEIHEGGELGVDSLTFKWSRDNGSVVKAILPIANTTDFTVESGPDELLELANGQWVEQVDDAIDLNAVARDLFQFQRNPVTGAVTLNYPVDLARHPKLRRWDSPDAVEIPFPPVGGGWIALENGVEVRFEPGTYRTGDYWLIPARTVLGDVEWPSDAAGEPLARARRGIRHHYCRIGVLEVEGDDLEVEDCRPVFPPLNELKATYSCCTFTVGDGVDYVGDFTLIQEAVNHLPAQGGQICIFPGTYVENVLIDGLQNVHIKGCGKRTRIVSNPPNADGVAQAVFHLVSTMGVKIESLAVEAAETAPGILADGETANVGLVIEKVALKAAKRSAIRVRGSQDVTIEHCHIEMTDFNGGRPGIHLQTEVGLVRENVVLGTLIGMTPQQVFGLEGALVVSGLQLAGGCERIRVHDNLFQGCSGQGITLGSLVQLGPDGEPTEPGDGEDGGDDPCDICDDPSTGEEPPDGGEEPPRWVSEGLLRDIDIRRNRIFDTGLDGIGVVRFFDFSRVEKLSASVLIQDLAIVDNRIQRCVRRRFAPIPPAMLDLMAYGGVSLSLVEGLVIRDNRIEDIGAGGVLPVCGIFVLYVEGLEVGRNHILVIGPPLPESVANLVGRRGGVHCVFALPLASAVAGGAPDVPALAAAQPLALRVAAPAAVVEENTVDVVRGQALSLGALGPVSVVANRLASRGLVTADLLALLQGGNAFNVLLHLSSLVAIVNLGSPGGGPVNMGAAATGVSANAANVFDRNGKVLFDDNQCVLDLVHGPAGPGPSLPGGALLPAILILSLDDIGFADNQCDCYIAEGTMPVATLLLGLLSTRAAANRFSETLARAQFSAFTFALMNMTVNNQANHCLRIIGPLRLQAQPNHILITAFLKDYCPNAERNLISMMRTFS